MELQTWCLYECPESAAWDRWEILQQGKKSTGWYRGMSQFLKVPLHILSSQQIKGERSYLELNRENSLHHLWTVGIRVLPGHSSSLCPLYFGAVPDSKDYFCQVAPIAGEVWETHADPTMEEHCSLSSGHCSGDWFMICMKRGLHRPDFQRPGMFLFSS